MSANMGPNSKKQNKLRFTRQGLPSTNQEQQGSSEGRGSGIDYNDDQQKVRIYLSQGSSKILPGSQLRSLGGSWFVCTQTHSMLADGKYHVLLIL